MFDYPTACRFGNPPSVQNSAAATSPGRRRPQYRLAPQHGAAATYNADDRAALVARVILRICDRSNDVPGEIEALLRAEFAEVARHG